MPRLMQNVHVDGKWYGPDYGNADVPSKIAGMIDNPAAWVDPSAEPTASALSGAGDLDSLSRADLQALAEDRGVEYDAKDTKATLIERLSAS